MRRVLKLALATAAVGMGMGIATPAAAATVVGNIAVAGSSGTCDTVPTADTSPASINCVGYFSGNVLNNGNTSISPYTTDAQLITAALAALGVTYDGDISTYFGGATTDPATLFGTLTGVQVIGIHWGGGSSQTDPTVGNVTAFYKIDFGAGGTLSPNLQGISNAYLFTPRTPLPEPATWAMMLLGFGGIGMAFRRGKRRSSAKLLQIA